MPKFKTPILFIIFNRPENTQKVFAQIKKIQPQFLYIHADGPRGNTPSDKELCKKTREIVNQIDWDCELKTLFREDNLGIKKGVSSAIDWFFENEEMGIIFEDDTVPSLSFFGFCDNLLHKYRHDERIMMISGNNFIPADKMPNYEYDYFFNYFSFIWGWATWRRAWILYKPEMQDWQEFKENKKLKYFFPNTKWWIRKSITNQWEASYKNIVQSWASSWGLSVLKNNGLVILPAKNLVTNIGSDGVHFSNSKISSSLFVRTHDIDTNNIKHPESVMPDYNLQNLNLKNTPFNRPFIVWFKNFIRRIQDF